MNNFNMKDAKEKASQNVKLISEEEFIRVSSDVVTELADSFAHDANGMNGIVVGMLGTLVAAKINAKLFKSEE